MQIHVNTDDRIQGGESLVQWVQQEAQGKLTRFRDHVTRVEVFLTDEDSHKSGALDKRCRLEARITGRQPVAVGAEADKLADAVYGALEKLQRALDADIGRQRDHRNRETIRTQEPDAAA